MPDPDNAAATEKIYKRLSCLYLLSEQLLSVTDEEELFDLVLSTATKDTDAERGFLGLVPEGQQADPYALNVVRFWDRDQGKKAETLEMSESILQHIQRERKAVLVRDVADKRDFGMSVVNLKIR